MSCFFELFLLVLALSADAFTASFVYGADRVKIPFLSAAVITFLSTGILAFFLLAGSFLKAFLPGNLPSLCSVLLLFLLGLAKLTARPVRDMARRANDRDPEVLSAGEAFVLGAALSMDSAAAGIGTGLTGTSLPLLMILSLVTGFLSVTGGGRLGRIVSGRTSMDFSKAGGMVLMLLALMKLI